MRGVRAFSSLCGADVELVRDFSPALHCVESRNAGDVGQVFSFKELADMYPTPGTNHWRPHFCFVLLYYVPDLFCLLFEVRVTPTRDSQEGFRVSS